MAEGASGDSTAQLLDPAFDLPRTLSLLQTKNDTSRFVGLALLKSLLDNQISLRDDGKIITECWTAISASFLDRLLRARAKATEGKSKDEARDMVELAVAVIHTFALLLPNQSDGKLLGRAKGLIAVLVDSTPETTILILQSLLVVASQESGAQALWNIDDLSPLIEITPQQPLALDVIVYMALNRYKGLAKSITFPETVAKTLTSLVFAFRDTLEPQTLFESLTKIFTSLPYESFPSPDSWLQPLVKQILHTLVARPKPLIRHAAVELAATLLKSYPTQTPTFLFWSPPSSRRKRFTVCSKHRPPPCYLVVTAILIDLRSTLPSLPALLNSTGATSPYLVLSRRLSADLTIVTYFLGHLIRSLDLFDSDSDSASDSDAGSDVEGNGESRSKHPLPPDLLLKLRTSLAETMSCLIDFLREAYDINPSLMRDDDSLAIDAIRALAIFLHEDDGPTLRQEGASIIDILLSTFQHSSIAMSPTLMAIEAIVRSSDGVSTLLSHDGWSILSSPLIDVLEHPSHLPSPPADSSSTTPLSESLLNSSPATLPEPHPNPPLVTTSLTTTTTTTPPQSRPNTPESVHNPSQTPATNSKIIGDHTFLDIAATLLTLLQQPSITTIPESWLRLLHATTLLPVPINSPPAPTTITTLHIQYAKLCVVILDKVSPFQLLSLTTERTALTIWTQAMAKSFLSIDDPFSSSSTTLDSSPPHQSVSAPDTKFANEVMELAGDVMGLSKGIDTLSI